MPTAEETLSIIRTALQAFDAPPVQPPPSPLVLTVPAGGNLQAALDGEAPIIALEPAEYGPAIVRRPVEIRGNGATLVGSTGPAFWAPPGPRTFDIYARDLFARTSHPGAVVQTGALDDSQNLAALAPRRILFERVTVPSHRGKFGFQISSAETDLIECSARDVYTTWGQDSTALLIANSPGDVRVNGGLYEGGSECAMLGGEWQRMTDCSYIERVRFEGVTFSRPQAWRTNADTENVKNIFEVKNGRGVELVDCLLDGCWQDAQGGYGIMLTPTRAGAVTDVLLRRLTVRNVGGGINVTGFDTGSTVTVRTTGIRLEDSTFEISKVANGGTGWFLLLQRGVGTVDLARVNVTHDGTAFVYHEGPIVERLSIVDGNWNAGAYGIRSPYGNNATNWAQAFAALTVTGNAIRNAASALKTNLPQNQYV